MQSGSLVEHIGTGQWRCQNSGKKVNGPSKGDINVMKDVDSTDERYILLEEYPPLCECGCAGSSGMPATSFREVQPPMNVSVESIINQPA